MEKTNKQTNKQVFLILTLKVYCPLWSISQVQAWTDTVVVFTNALALQEQCVRPEVYSGPSPVASIREHHAADDVGELITEVGTWAEERRLTKLQVASVILEQAGHTTLLIVISWYKIKSSNLKKIIRRTSRPHKIRRITLCLRSFHPWFRVRDKFSPPSSHTLLVFLSKGISLFLLTSD